MENVEPYSQVKLIGSAVHIQWGHLERNPAKGIKKYPEAGPRERNLSGDELTRFLSAVDEEGGKSTTNALKLLLLTGLRSKSELFSLPWSEVDLDRGTVRLLRTKNGRVRTVALNSVALDLLKAMRTDAIPGGTWVFPARTGNGHLVDIRKPLKRAMVRANLKDLRPHDLRRSFGSLAVNAGVDIYQVMGLLGHSSVAVTQRVYAHLLQGTLRNASEVVAKTLGEARGMMTIAGKDLLINSGSAVVGL
jgi:integrase